MVVVQGDPDLPEVIDALQAPRGFTSRLDRRQQQGDQHGEDRDDDKQLDQRETAKPLHDNENSSMTAGS